MMAEARAPTALPAPWGEHEVPGDEIVSIDLGPLRLNLRLRDDEIWIATTRVDSVEAIETVEAIEVAETVEPLESEPVEADWLRWPVAGGTRSVRLSPAFPDRTVVAQPEVPMRLVSGANARVFVRVPLWVRVSTDGGVLLTEVPTVGLSDTWLGGFTSGELCYWLGTTARRHVSDDIFAPNLAVCPLILSNRSGDEAPVERLAVHVENLRLYCDGDHFWSNDSRIRFRGAEEDSHIDLTDRPPSEVPAAVTVAEPRDSSPPGASRILGFARLRAFPGFGG